MHRLYSGVLFNKRTSVFPAKTSLDIGRFSADVAAPQRHSLTVDRRLASRSRRRSNSA